MTRLTRVLLLVGLLVLVLVLASGGAGYRYLQASLPETEGTVEGAGVSAPVEITFDAMGVPHVWAQTEADALFALGWLHAGHRWFQMELVRRAASGRLAEMLGEVALEIDRRQRIVGHARIGREEVARLGARERRLLEAYRDGINRYAGLHAPPFEFTLLGLDPEPWTLEDLMTVLSFQIWYPGALRTHDDLFFEPLLGRIGDDTLRTLVPEYPAWAPTTVPPDEGDGPSLAPAPEIGQRAAAAGSGAAGLAAALAASREAAAGFLRERLFRDASAVEALVRSLRMGGASNVWAVAPQRSASGAAVLANDPHLDISRLPGFWYLAGLHAADAGLDAVGITAPGLPFLAMGHTPRVAWGFTVAGVDLRDHYRETLHPDDPGRYRTPDGWRPFERIEETIHVAGRDEPERLTVEVSRHGPVVRRDSASHAAVAWRWAGYDFSAAEAARASFDIPRAADGPAFREVVAGLGAININFIYADADGGIGYQLVPRPPVRPFAGSALPLDGSTDATDWRGYHPVEDVPHAADPARGWLANSNNKGARPDYPLPGTYHTDRILRLNGLLSAGGPFDAAAMRAMQLDSTDAFALRRRDDAVALLRAMGEDEEAHALASWTGEMGAGSHPAALLNVWLDRLNTAIFFDELGRQAPYDVLDKIYDERDSFWYDDVGTPEVETRGRVARRAMEAALGVTRGRTWGELNTLTVRHPFAEIGALEALLDLERGPYPMGGSWGTLNASFYFPDREGPLEDGGLTFATLIGASWRRVVDFADVDGAMMALPAGQSGHPLSPHFFDFFELWRAGSYWNVPLSRERVEAAAVSRLVLNP